MAADSASTAQASDGLVTRFNVVHSLVAAALRSHSQGGAGSGAAKAERRSGGRPRRASKARGVSVEASHVVWIGSTHDRLEHGVTLDRMTANVGSGHGVYDALCGEKFIPLPMLSGPCPRCLRCLRRLEVSAARPRQARHRRWRVGLLRRESESCSKALRGEEG